MVVDDKFVRICASGNKDGVTEMIENESENNNVNAKILHGKSPIEVATCFGHIGVVEELIKNGVEVQQTSQSGYTLLHWAACWGRLELVKFFVESNVNIFLKNNNDETATEIAERYEKMDCVAFLKKAELLQNFKQLALSYKEIIADPEKNQGRFAKEDKVHGNRNCDDKLDWIEANRDIASYQTILDKKEELIEQLKNTMNKLEQ